MLEKFYPGEYLDSKLILTYEEGYRGILNI